jgi:hypothetical protein
LFAIVARLIVAPVVVAWVIEAFARHGIVLRQDVGQRRHRVAGERRNGRRDGLDRSVDFRGGVLGGHA